MELQAAMRVPSAAESLKPAALPRSTSEAHDDRVIHRPHAFDLARDALGHALLGLALRCEARLRWFGDTSRSLRRSVRGGRTIAISFDCRAAPGRMTLLATPPVPRHGCLDNRPRFEEMPVDVLRRNNVVVRGDGPATLVFAHGFGCDLNMWRLMAPAFEKRFRVVLFDLVGSGMSELAAYDRNKYGTLGGYADDVLEIVDQVAAGPVIFVGHSVSAMIGLLADIKAPGRFAAQIMVGPSPCYINEGDYVGGFKRADIDSLLETLESNYLGWSSTMAPAIMGASDKPELGIELTNSFCRTDPEIAKHFARVTFLSDHRADLPQLQTPALILQCSDDLIAPRSVGEYMHRVMPDATLRIIDNVGHCPHLSEPCASLTAMNEFLSTTVP
jgi:sigma-B regulation protein RsbQ